MSEVNKILDERELTHGDYSNTARIIQKLKAVVMYELSQRNTRGQAPLDHVQRESIDMIVHKVGRIISGNPNTKDHWDDIAGYAQLASMRVTEPVAKKVVEAVEHALQEPSTVEATASGEVQVPKPSRAERMLAKMAFPNLNQESQGID